METKFILQSIRNGKKDYREIYLNYLLEQFKNATGYKKVDLNSDIFKAEFNSWLFTRTNISEDYIKVLDYMELGYHYPMTAELGKGCLDSVVSHNGTTTIITPYTYGLDKKTGNKIIRGSINCVRNRTNHESLKEDKRTETIDSFMTQNPYTLDDFYTLEMMHNTQMYDIIAGVYGKSQDKDKEEKLKVLKAFKDNLYGDFEEEYIRFNDNYCYVIATKAKTKINTRVR